MYVYTRYPKQGSKYLVRHYHFTYNEPCVFPTKGRGPWWQRWGQETHWWFLRSGSITWKHWRRACRSMCGATLLNTHSSTACMRFFQLTLTSNSKKNHHHFPSLSYSVSDSLCCYSWSRYEQPVPFEEEWTWELKGKAAKIYIEMVGYVLHAVCVCSHPSPSFC